MSDSIGSAPATPLPVVIDTDPGIDDALALLLALHSPELDVRAISVSYGNTGAEHAFRNAVEILRRAKRRVRLGLGARRPLRRALQVARETHGDSGLGYAQVPAPGVVLDFMRPLDRILADQVEPVTLVTLGPLTSLALALNSDPDLVRSKVKRHVAMVGNLEARGTATAFSEFNAWCDPEALCTVLAAELPTDLVTLDVTRLLVLSAADVSRLGAVQTPNAQWIYDALRFYVEFHRAHEGFDGCVINDVLAIAALIDPQILRFEPARISVDLNQDDYRGRTRPVPDGSHVRIAHEGKVSRARALLSDRVLHWAATLAPPALVPAEVSA